MRRLPELDGLRAVAILAVLIVHARVLPGGFLGVDLFFVLSGFLITSLLVEEHARTGAVSLRSFYWRRALRILPPLLATLVLVIALSPILGLPPLAPSLFFYANFADHHTLGPLKHTWSLAIEEQFYVLWPLAFLALGRWRMLALVAVIGARLRFGRMRSGTDSNSSRYTDPASRAPMRSRWVALRRWHWGNGPIRFARDSDILGSLGLGSPLLSRSS